MPITKQWPGGATNATPTSFSLPLNNELNWLQLTSFLQSLADSAQGTTFQKFKVRVVTASPDTISATADCILAVNVAGAVTINLPAGAEKQIFFIVDSSGAAVTNNITITPNGSETVRGGASLVLNKNYQGVVLAFTGTDWKAFGPFTTPGSITDADFTGQLSTAKGGTGQNSTATFPTSGTVATVPSAGVVKSSGTALTSSNVNLTSEVTGTLPVANGGTGITSFGTGIATFLGTPSSANLASAVTDETGTGALVFANTPTLVTPILGTPQSATLTNATGLPIDAGTTGTLPASRGGTGVTSLGTGIATFLGTPSSANLASAVTDETGTGALVFANTPTLVTPILGTPQSATLTNATGLPIDAGTTGTLPASRGGTGVTSLGTGVATALGQNVTGSGSIVLSGSPTFTGTPISPSVQISGTAGAGFVELAEQASSPATPSSGFARIYPKTDNKLYLKDDTGVETQLGAGGVGEINVVENPSDANNWGTSNATVTTTTTAANLPLGPLVDTAIEITSSTSGGYARYRWTMPVSLRQRKLKVAWQQVAATLTSGDYKVEVYKNSASDYSGSYTEFSLSTDSSGTSSIPNLNGQYQTTFDADDGIYYELRVVRTAASSATIRLAGVTVGPGIQPQGAVVGEWQISTTPTVGGLGSKGLSSSSFRYRRVGSNMELYFQFIGNNTASGTGTTDITFTIPDGFTRNTTIATSGDATSFGAVQTWGVTSSGVYDYATVAMPGATNNTVRFLKPNANATYVTSDLNVSRTISFEGFLTIPIAEWAGSGTVQLAQNDVEYAATSGTWDADSSTTVYGPGGVQMGGALSAFRTKTVTFQTPIQAGDKIEVEVSIDRTIWLPINASTASAGGGPVVPSFNSVGDYASGCAWYKSSATAVSVLFGRYALVANDDSPTGDWSSTFYWRVRKSSAGAAVGFGIVQPGTSAGLVSASGLPGNTTGNAIAAGYVGQVLESTQTLSNLTSGNYATLNLSLGAGIWLITGMINYKRNGATITGLSYNAQIVPNGSGNPSDELYFSIQDSSFSSTYTYLSFQAPATVVRCDGTNIVVPGFTSQATTSIQLRFYAGTFTGGPVQATALVRGIRIA